MYSRKSSSRLSSDLNPQVKVKNCLNVKSQSVVDTTWLLWIG